MLLLPSYTFRGRRIFRRVVLVLFLTFAAVAAVKLIQTLIADQREDFFDSSDGSHSLAGCIRPRLNVGTTVEREDFFDSSDGSHRHARCIRPRLNVGTTVARTGDRRASSLRLRCDELEPNWISTSNGTFLISASSRRKHGDILCEYVPILRNGDDFELTRGRPVKPMLNGSALPTDAFEASCVGTDGSVHVGTYSGVAFNPDVEDRCKRSSRARDGDVEVDDDDALDILIFGFDSVSRQAWLRMLPETHRYFIEQLGGVVIEGYNIVGDGTPRALLPLLTGHTETELPEARRRFQNATTVDNHPWIWRRLMSHRRYATQWGEDEAYIGTFTHRMLGFRDQPVDHYMRPFYLAAEKQYPWYEPYCLGSVPRHRNLLAWQRDFFDLYGSGSSCRRFSFVFHSELSHRVHQLLPLADRDLREHLAGLKAAGHLQNTAIVLMSDHGSRIDAARSTTNGKYEERLPYLAIRLPPSYAKRFPEKLANLRRNAGEDRLTTAFDLHETLLEFAAIADNLGPPEVQQDHRLPRRGISLLGEIPALRTCADADVAPHWCTCLQWRRTSVDDPNVRQAAVEVVDAINRITLSLHSVDCFRLTLDVIQSAELYAADKRLLLFRRSADVDGRVPEMMTPLQGQTSGLGPEVLYRVTMMTSPGGGMYEATVRLMTEKRKFIVDMRQISRINAYGNQPHCIASTEPHLRPYCLCVVPFNATSSSPIR